MSTLQSNNPYSTKTHRRNFAEYIREMIRISPEDVIADARNVGLMVDSVDGFRSLSRQRRRMVDQLTNHYINGDYILHARLAWHRVTAKLQPCIKYIIPILISPQNGAPSAGQLLEWGEW
jgi:hypothetical protein